MRTQRTVSSEGLLKGVGLHSGAMCSVALKPASENFGIQFFKEGKRVAFSSSQALRQSSIGEGSESVMTVEHLLSALVGLGISNVAVHVEGPELPACDGSAKEFVSWIKSLGILEQKASLKPYCIKEPVFCWENSKAIAMFPSDKLEIAYLLRYDSPAIGTQKIDITVTPETFENEIAPARTFCSKEESGELLQKGFGKGATSQNNLVIGPNGPIGNSFRFPDECVRHKVLDIIGDLGLLGFPVLGRVVAIRSGHSLNQKLAQMILKQKEATAC